MVFKALAVKVVISYNILNIEIVTKENSMIFFQVTVCQKQTSFSLRKKNSIPGNAIVLKNIFNTVNNLDFVIHYKVSSGFIKIYRSH